MSRMRTFTLVKDGATGGDPRRGCGFAVLVSPAPGVCFSAWGSSAGVGRSEPVPLSLHLSPQHAGCGVLLVRGLCQAFGSTAQWPVPWPVSGEAGFIWAGRTGKRGTEQPVPGLRRVWQRFSPNPCPCAGEFWRLGQRVGLCRRSVLVREGSPFPQHPPAGLVLSCPGPGLPLHPSAKGSSRRVLLSPQSWSEGRASLGRGGEQELAPALAARRRQVPVVVRLRVVVFPELKRSMCPPQRQGWAPGGPVCAARRPGTPGERAGWLQVRGSRLRLGNGLVAGEGRDALSRWRWHAASPAGVWATPRRQANREREAGAAGLAVTSLGFTRFCLQFSI